MRFLVFLSCFLVQIALSQVSAQYTFNLYTKLFPDRPTAVSNTTILVSGFQHIRPTFFLIHGFSSNAGITFLLKTKDALLNLLDANVIVIDWGLQAASPNYFAAQSNCREVGKRLAEFVNTTHMDIDRVTCIGHSLGAHACGFASKLKRISRIIGLDPAGPLYNSNPNSAKDRLDAADADQVDCIYTDDFFGINAPICQQNYFPNNAKNQPACASSTETIRISLALPGQKDEPVEGLSCSHSIVQNYLTESINNRGSCQFKSALCKDWNTFTQNTCPCTGENCISMGFYASAYKNSRGNFYLRTNNASPYCIN